MPAPNIPANIGVKVPNANEGEFVIVRNLTRGGQLTGALSGTDKNIVFNKAPAGEWQDKDLIQAEIDGSVTGMKQGTIATRKVDVSIKDASADTSTPGVDI